MEKTINKSLVPVNFIKGLAILYTFLVVVGMVGIVESKALLVYFGTQSVIQALLTGYGYIGSVLASILIWYNYSLPRCFCKCNLDAICNCGRVNTNMGLNTYRNSCLFRVIKNGSKDSF